MLYPGHPVLLEQVPVDPEAGNAEVDKGEAVQEPEGIADNIADLRVFAVLRGGDQDRAEDNRVVY